MDDTSRVDFVERRHDDGGCIRRVASTLMSDGAAVRIMCTGSRACSGRKKRLSRPSTRSNPSRVRATRCSLRSARYPSAAIESSGSRKRCRTSRRVLVTEVCLADRPEFQLKDELADEPLFVGRPIGAIQRNLVIPDGGRNTSPTYRGSERGRRSCGRKRQPRGPPCQRPATDDRCRRTASGRDPSPPCRHYARGSRPLRALRTPRQPSAASSTSQQPAAQTGPCPCNKFPLMVVLNGSSIW